MSIPRRTEEFDDQVSAAIESVRVASTTSWDYIDIREAGFWGDAWNSVSSFGKGVVDTAKGVGNVIGDVATGDFSDVGKDVKKTFNSVGKDLSKANDSANKAAHEGLHDLGQAAKATGNFVKNNWKPIAVGVGMGALALTGVGLLADAAIAGGAAAAGGAALAEGAAVAGGAALTEGAAVAGGAALAEGAVAGGAAAAEAAGAAGVVGAEGAVAGAEGVAAAAEGYSGAASATSAITEDVAAAGARETAKGFLKNRVTEPLKNLKGDFKENPFSTTVDVAKKGVVPSTVVGGGAEINDLSNKVDAANQELNTVKEQLTPPPQPLLPPQPQRQIDLNPTTQSAMAAPGAAPAAVAQGPVTIQAPSAPMPSIPSFTPSPADYGQMQLAASKKNSTVLDLVEEFGLYPEDIKRSLTSWQ